MVSISNGFFGITVNDIFVSGSLFEAYSYDNSTTKDIIFYLNKKDKLSVVAFGFNDEGSPGVVIGTEFIDGQTTPSATLNIIKID